jgi:hypothetical protein
VLIAIIVFIIILLNIVDITIKPKSSPPKKKEHHFNSTPLTPSAQEEKQKLGGVEEVKTPPGNENLKDQKPTKAAVTIRPTKKVPGEEKKQSESYNNKINNGVENKVKGPPSRELPGNREAIERKVEIVHIKDLSPDIFSNYKNQLKSIGELVINENITVEGSINLCLVIDDSGNIKVNDYDNSLLNVIPQSKRRLVTDLLITRINQHTLEPQKNSRGAYVKVINFRITIKVLQSKNTLKLGK